MTEQNPPPAARIPDGSVVITPVQMYERITSTEAKVDHLTAIIDPALQNIRDDVAELKTDAEKVHSDFETRLRALERWRWQAGTVVAVVVFAAGIFEAFIGR